MRIPRTYIKTSFFHIMVQGINKEYIFENERDKIKYLKIIKDIKQVYSAYILSYCIMNNHVHFLIYADNIKDLSNFMHMINMKYAMYYNKKYNRVGYVFRDRYKLQSIKNEGHLFTCIKYIHDNPVKAGLCDRAEQYKYSSALKNEFDGVNAIENLRNLLINSDKENAEPFILMEEDKDVIEDCQKFLLYIKAKNQISDFSQLKRNKKLLLEIILKLKNEYGYSYRKMEECLNISHETLRCIVNKSKKEM